MAASLGIELNKERFMGLLVSGLAQASETLVP
jgi:hypothetical protein